MLLLAVMDQHAWVSTQRDAGFLSEEHELLIIYSQGRNLQYLPWLF